MVICVVFAVVGSSRPGLVLSIFVILRLTVPSQAGGLIIGDWEGNEALHPATILLLVYAGVGVIARRDSLAKELSEHLGIYSCLLFVATAFVFVSTLESGPTSLVGLTNVVLSPLILVLMARVEEQSCPGSIRRLALAYLVTLACIAGLVLIQAALQSNLPWAFRIQNSYTSPGQGFRPLGTFDSPLDLAFACTIGIPIAALIARPLIRFAAALAFLLAVVLSESRAPTAAAILGCLWLIFATVRSAKAILPVIGVLTIAGVIASTTTALDGLLARLNGQDGNSSSQRSIAFDYVRDNIAGSLIAGGGWGSAYELRGTVLRTSLENSYAILAFDLGAIFVLGLLLTQLRIVMFRGGLPGAQVSAILGILLAFLYSGLVIMSAASTALWLALAMCFPTISSSPLDTQQRVHDRRGRTARNPPLLERTRPTTEKSNSVRA